MTNLEAPKYESVSAKYNITSAGSDLKSIELTASGNYLIVKNSNGTLRAPAAGKRNRWAAAARMVTRAGTDWYNNIIQGKFTKISDTEFRLEGYGTIIIIGSANDAVNLDITLANGSKVEVTAQRSTQMAESAMTSN